MQITTNSSTMSNSSEQQTKNSLGNVKKEELVRLLLQSLGDLGYG
jgi:hypothetical protein